MSEQTTLIQAKVNSKLFDKFKRIQNAEGKTIKRMFEEWLDFELMNYDRTMRGDVSGSFKRAWTLR